MISIRLVGVSVTVGLLALVAVTSSVSASHSFSMEPGAGAPGTIVSVKPSGITGGAAYQVYWDFVSPVSRGSLVARDSGNGRSSYQVPEDAAAGEHTVAMCVSCDGWLAHFVVQRFVVTGPPEVTPPLPAPTPEPAPPPTAPPAPEPPPTTAPAPPTQTPTPAPSRSASPSPSASASATPTQAPVATVASETATPAAAGGAEGEGGEGVPYLLITGAVLVGGTALGGLSAALIVIRTSGMGRSYRPFRRS
jgi:hypothetical protein